MGERYLKIKEGGRYVGYSYATQGGRGPVALTASFDRVGVPRAEVFSGSSVFSRPSFGSSLLTERRHANDTKLRGKFEHVIWRQILLGCIDDCMKIPVEALIERRSMRHMHDTVA